MNPMHHPPAQSFHRSILPAFSKRWVLFALWALTCLSSARSLAAGEVSSSDPLLARIPEVFRVATNQYERLLQVAGGETNFPRTFVGGKVVRVRARDWTSGFFPGSLWYLYQYTDDPKWRAAAETWTARLESLKHNRSTHDLGFMLFCSYGNGYRLTGNQQYREVLLEGARSLASRFNPTVGLIRSWDGGSWSYPVIIDNMMNLELLTWAAREGGEKRLRDVALSHADITLTNHFRPDASCFHVVDYDPASGAVVAKKTHQGAADDSAWARGQAWALYGYTMMHRETGREVYLEQAKKIARFILNHPRLPADKVPYWDFDAPGIPDVPRDASAAAIMASALLELSGRVDGELAKSYRELAREQLLSLSSPAYLARPGENGGFILLHSTGHHPNNSEIDVPLNYADYYFLEALLRYEKLARAR